MKNNSKSVNLIIQGPIFSPGINGNGEMVEYNCVKNINQVLTNYKHIFEHIVLVTWVTEDISRIDKHENLHIIQVEDIGGNGKRTSSYWKTENIKRQFFSTWVAVNYLNDFIEQTDLIVKLRTDQSIDLSMLTKELINIYLEQQDKIVVPNLNNRFIYPSDFIFAGSLERMDKFLSDQLYSLTPLYNAHESMIYNYNRNKNTSEFQLFVNLIFWNKKSRAKRIFNNYSFFSKRIMETCYWRGAFVKNFDQKQFNYKMPNNNLDIAFHFRKYINIKRFISAGILDRKQSKNQLDKLIDIIENKRMITVLYRSNN